MFYDVLVIVRNSFLRSRIINILNKNNNRFRFLDQASVGHIGLEKAYTLNPDIIILESASGYIDGYSIATQLRTNYYTCKILMLKDASEISMYDETVTCNIYGTLPTVSVSEVSLLNILEHIIKLDSPNYSEIDLFTMLKSCQTKTELSILIERYNLKLLSNTTYHMMTCALLTKAISKNSILRILNECKEIIKLYNNGIIFHHEGLFYFIINKHEKMENIFKRISNIIKNQLEDKLYFFIFYNISGIDALKKYLLNAADYNRYCFFNIYNNILNEDYLNKNKSKIEHSVIDKSIKNIRSDIIEMDYDDMIKNIKHLMLENIKYKMDFEAFYYASNQLCNLYKDFYFDDNDLDKDIFLSGNEITIEESTEIICNSFYELTFNLGPLVHKYGFIKSAIKYIRNNYSTSISLSEVAESLRVSTSYFSHSFKECVGMSFTEYLLFVRLNRAKELLLEDNYKIYEISDLIGIKNVKYFNILFKKKIKRTPSEFRHYIQKVN